MTVPGPGTTTGRTRNAADMTAKLWPVLWCSAQALGQVAMVTALAFSTADVWGC